MNHNLTLEQIRDLQKRGYKVTFHTGEKLGAKVQYFKIQALTIHINKIPKLYLPSEFGEIDNFLPELKKTILN